MELARLICILKKVGTGLRMTCPRSEENSESLAKAAYQPSLSFMILICRSRLNDRSHGGMHLVEYGEPNGCQYS